MNQKPNIFRQESLERLSSPERLDQLMQVVAPRDWLFLAALGAMVMGAVSWSIWGRIPVTVEGRGILLYPDQTTALQSPIAGQLATFTLKAGDRIQTGQVIGSIDRRDLRQALQQQTLKLQRLQQQQQQQAMATERQSAAALKALQQKEQTLSKTLQNQQALIEPVRRTEQLTLQKQRQALEQALRDKTAIARVLRQQLDNRQRLSNEGAISTDLLLESTQAYQDNQQEIATIKSQLQELTRKSLTIEQIYRDSLSQIQDLQAQLQEIQNQRTQIQQRSLDAEIQRDNQRRDLQQQIEQLTLELQRNSRITSPHSGRVIEVNARTGQILQPGAVLGMVKVDTPTEPLVAIAYFSIKDGKRLQAGMPMQISPDSVPRERYGGIVGSVKSVSPLPVSQQTMINTVGNPEVVESLRVPGGQLEVAATLQANATTFSGYQWSSSRGPQVNISAGTTTAVRVTVEQQAPITFVLPIFKSFSHLY